MNNNFILNFDSHIIRNKKITLVKDKRFQHKNIIISKKILKRIEKKDFIEEKFKNYIKIFINTLIEKNTSLDLTLFMKNLKTLNIKVTDMPDYRPASYDVKANTIYINEKYINDENVEIYFFHELFHVLGRKEQEGRYYTGLSSDVMGTGINEGYTELLVLKYFYKPSYNTNNYILEQQIANAMETIIGEEKLEKIYSKFGFWPFIDEISKYHNEERSYSYHIIIDIERVFDNDLYLTDKKSDINKFTCSLERGIRKLIELFKNKQEIESFSNEEIDRFFASIHTLVYLAESRTNLSITLEDVQNYKSECYNRPKIKNKI